MALNIEDKKAIVAEVAEVAKKAVSAVTANSCGIPVSKQSVTIVYCPDGQKAKKQCEIDIALFAEDLSVCGYYFGYVYIKLLIF